MIMRNHSGDTPRVDDTAFIHPSAVLIGNVQIGEKVFVGPNAVIRADESGPEGRAAAIIIESEANIQDGVIINALDGSPVRIGKKACLAHEAVISGPCDIGEQCFIGFESAVFNATLGKGVVVQYRAFVEDVAIAAGIHVPPMHVVLNEEDVRRLRPASTAMKAYSDKVCVTTTYLAQVA